MKDVDNANTNIKNVSASVMMEYIIRSQRGLNV